MPQGERGAEPCHWIIIRGEPRRFMPDRSMLARGDSGARLSTSVREIHPATKRGSRPSWRRTGCLNLESSGEREYPALLQLAEITG